VVLSQITATCGQKQEEMDLLAGAVQSQKIHSLHILHSQGVVFGEHCPVFPFGSSKKFFFVVTFGDIILNNSKNYYYQKKLV